MSINAQGTTAPKDRPLTRADVEVILQKVGNSSKLNLSGRNMAGIDLKKLILREAILSGAILSGANLYSTDLYSTDLYSAILTEANLTEAILTSGAILTEAILTGTNLTGADLTGANAFRAVLIGANLTEANLTGANLTGADLYRANLAGADLIEAIFDQVTVSKVENARSTSTFRILIIEEPLTPYNLTTIISALTELSTMYWLIAKGRFSDLIEYSQTRNVQFAEEAELAITKVTYNSPFNMDWKIDLSAPSVAEGIITTVDGISQRRAKLEKAELENQAKA